MKTRTLEEKADALLKLIKPQQVTEEQMTELKQLLNEIEKGTLTSVETDLIHRHQLDLMHYVFSHNDHQRAALLLNHTPELLFTQTSYKRDDKNGKKLLKLPHEHAKNKKSKLTDFLTQEYEKENKKRSFPVSHQLSDLMVPAEIKEDELETVKKLLLTIPHGDLVKIQIQLDNDNKGGLLFNALSHTDVARTRLLLEHSPALALYKYFLSHEHGGDGKTSKFPRDHAYDRKNCLPEIKQLLSQTHETALRQTDLEKLSNIMAASKKMTVLEKAEVRGILSRIEKGTLPTLLHNLLLPSDIEKLNLLLKHSPNLALKECLVNNENTFPLQHAIIQKSSPQIVGLLFRLHRAQIDTLEGEKLITAYRVMSESIKISLREFKEALRHTWRFKHSPEADQLIQNLDALLTKAPTIVGSAVQDHQTFIKNVQECLQPYLSKTSCKTAAIIGGFPTSLRTLKENNLFFMFDGPQIMMQGMVDSKKPVTKKLEEDDTASQRAAGSFPFFYLMKSGPTTVQPAAELTDNQILNRMLTDFFENPETFEYLQAIEEQQNETQTTGETLESEGEEKDDACKQPAKKYIAMTDAIWQILRIPHLNLDTDTANKIIRYIKQAALPGNKPLAEIPAISKWVSDADLLVLQNEFKNRLIEKINNIKYWKQGDELQTDSITQKTFKTTVLESMDDLVSVEYKNEPPPETKQFILRLKDLKERVDIDSIEAWSLELSRTLHQYVSADAHIWSRHHGEIFRLFECAPTMIKGVIRSNLLSKRKLELLLNLHDQLQCPHSPDFVKELLEGIKLVLDSQEMMPLSTKVVNQLFAFMNKVQQTVDGTEIRREAVWNMLSTEDLYRELKLLFNGVLHNHQRKLQAQLPVPSAPPFIAEPVVIAVPVNLASNSVYPELSSNPGVVQAEALVLAEVPVQIEKPEEEQQNLELENEPGAVPQQVASAATSTARNNMASSVLNNSPKSSNHPNSHWRQKPRTSRTEQPIEMAKKTVVLNF